MLALTPQNDAAFIREVDEELRREQVTTIWRRYGRVMLVAVVVALAALAGFLFWKSHHQGQAGAAGEQLVKALNDIDSGNQPAAQASLKALTGSSYDGYSAAARFTEAALLLQKNDAKGAAAAYKAIAADAGVAEPFRQLALIRQTAAEFDTLPPAEVVTRMKPYAVPDSPWYGSAGEMTAIALLRQGRTPEAAAQFAALARNKAVPETIRLRASKIASGYGVDGLGDAAANPTKE
jgi:hypothetical protein